MTKLVGQVSLVFGNQSFGGYTNPSTRFIVHQYPWPLHDSIGTGLYWN
jgi:hypothetical protein